MADDKEKCVRRRAVYRESSSAVANEIRDLMSEHENLDEDRQHRMLSLKNSVNNKLQKIKEFDENIENILISQKDDEYEIEMKNILNFREQYFDLFAKIGGLTGCGGEYDVPMRM